MKSARVERNLEAQKATYLWEALRPRAGEKPGRLLRNLILKGFGSVDAPTRRETMARALEFEDAVDDGVESARRAVFERFCALCDEQGRGNVLLSDFLNALTSARGGALWTPKRLDGAIDPVTTSVRWKNMTEAEARSVFSFFVTQFDERSQGMRMDYETFSRAVEHTGSPEVAAAYSLFAEIASVGVIAGQILEILTNPNIPSFSDETTWINPEEASRLYDDDEDEDEPPSDFAREAKLMTAAIRACRRNRPRDIEELVEVKGLYVDARDETGATPLVVAAAASQSEAAKFLISRGADPNAANARGDAPLHWACYRGDVLSARALLAAGADVHARGDVGNTPLHMACTEHHDVIARELLSRGADVFARNDVQITPLGVATDPSLRAVVKSVETDGDAARALLRRELALRAVAETARAAAEEKALALEAAANKAALEATESKRREDDEAQRVLELTEAKAEAAAVKAELAAIREAEAEAARKAEEERLRAEAEKAAKKAAKKGKGKGKGKKGK